MSVFFVSFHNRRSLKTKATHFSSTTLPNFPALFPFGVPVSDHQRKQFGLSPMSSDLFVDDGSFYRHAFESDPFSDPFSPFPDSAIDILHAFSDHQNQVEDQPHSLEQSSPNPVSSSPPNSQLENLSLYQETHLSPFDNGLNLENFSALDNLEVKTEQCHLAFDQNAYSYNPQVTQQAFAPHSYSGGAEHVAKFMQRSYSSNCFDGKPGFVFQPCFDSLMESPNFQSQAASLSSPESSYLTSHMRRVSSTGDLQNSRTARNPRESTAMEEAGNFKMGKYTAEERKERISKYKAKRAQRNFNKTIKYACRKTLADNRPRIRGRFARNDDTSENLKPACSTREEDEDDLWIEGLNNVEDELGERVVRGGQQFMKNNNEPQQFRYFGYYH
ncbi:two-component response regulator-like APRR5 [Argentina anserina]|uniref:two-component response regulator-like APRR5 n=1 Tax=Argentina anserina TaxID=57926 RepID=UPI0021762D26|nr:two-component response regulator-like APRR5 [Potentilla anserina]